MGDAQQCQPGYNPQTTSSDVGNMVSQLLSKLKAAQQGCTTSNFQGALSGEINGGLLMAGAGAKFAASMSDSSVAGCQSIAAITQNYLNDVYQSRCMITNDTNSSKMIVDISEKIKISAVGGSTINCSSLTIKQGSKIAVKSFNSLTASVKNKIAAQVKQGMSNAINQVQKQTTGAGATPETSDAFQTLQNKIQDTDMTTTLNNAATTVENKINALYNVDLNAVNDSTLNLGPCDISQFSIIDLQLGEIISQAYGNVMSTTMSQFLKSTDSQKQVVVNKGPPSALDMFKSDTSLWMMIGGGILLLVVVMIIAKSMKGSGTPPYPPGAYPPGAYPGGMPQLPPGMKLPGNLAGEAGALESAGGEASKLESVGGEASKIADVAELAFPRRRYNKFSIY